MSVCRPPEAQRDEAARIAKLTGNVWSMRCIEKCLDRRLSEAVPLIWHIAKNLTVLAPCQNLELANEALSEIAERNRFRNGTG
ncbi:MAG: hypothetical protein FWD12_12230, partial [Alphaproteobacteria bacterium]|nr:hypothetical protein [Alphaproteobacteria bacterium]